MKAAVKITAQLIILSLLVFLAPVYAQNCPQPIVMRMTYSIKPQTAREFLLIYDQTHSIPENQTVSGTIDDKEEDYSFKFELTPDIATDAPDLVDLHLKVWERRDVSVNGKYERQYCLIVDQTSRVKNDSTMVVNQNVAVDRDIQITITPSFCN